MYILYSEHLSKRRVQNRFFCLAEGPCPGEIGHDGFGAACGALAAPWLVCSSPNPFRQGGWSSPNSLFGVGNRDPS